MSAVIVDDQFRASIEAFAAHCKQITQDYYTASNYSFPAPDYVLDYGDKWCRIWRRDQADTTAGRNGSAYAFIALCDFENKQLGKVKQGDIHKPASWKAPAKHARGSVFNVDFNNCAGPHGIQYLR